MPLLQVTGPTPTGRRILRAVDWRKRRAEEPWAKVPQSKWDVPARERARFNWQKYYKMDSKVRRAECLWCLVLYQIMTFRWIFKQGRERCSTDFSTKLQVLASVNTDKPKRLGSPNHYSKWSWHISYFKDGGGQHLHSNNAAVSTTFCAKYIDQRISYHKDGPVWWNDPNKWAIVPRKCDKGINLFPRQCLSQPPHQRSQTLSREGNEAYRLLCAAGSTDLPKTIDSSA